MPYEVRGKCIYKKDGGAKVGCTKGSVKKYLAALHANANESTTKDLIKRLVRENISLFLKDETPEHCSFDILMNQIPVGRITMGQAPNNFGKDTLEIMNVVFKKNVNHLATAKKTIIKIFENYPDINRILIQPNVESRDFWFKLDGQRLSSKYMIILRGH